jgi:hypothetical protein
MKFVMTKRQLKILDFDIENRPLSYWYDGNCTAEITAIAASWVDSDVVEAKVLTLDPNSLKEMLKWFVNLYDQADIVTGHYIKKHDLKIVNGALLEQGMAPLSSKRVSDTKIDLVERSDISVSQESLGEILRLAHPKHHMSPQDWREANRLTAKGVKATQARVVKDVEQHKEMRAALLTNGWLKEPGWWDPSA